MRMKHNYLPIFLIIGIVLVSGCTKDKNTSGGGGSDALVVKSFSPEITEIEPTDDVSILATIENVGGAKATNIRAQLLGLTDEWSIKPERTQQIEDLLPPDPSRQLQGDVREIVWDLSPPRNPAKKVKLDYDMELRVYYSYKTYSENLMRVATRSYIDTFPTDQKQAEREKLKVSTSVPSSGPISVSILARSFLLDTASDTMSITLDIQNTGSGKPDNDKIGVNIKSAGRDLDCPGVSGGEVKLTTGKSRQLRCAVNIPGVAERGWQEVPISIELSYTYWVSSVSSITVLGAEVE